MSEWITEKMGNVASFLNGRAYKASEFKEFGTPIIRIQNLTGVGNYVYSDLELEENKYIDKNDLIYAWSATFGPYIWKGPKSIYHYHIWKILCHKEKLNKKYFYYHLLNVSDELRDQGNGTLFIHITKELMENFNMKLPPLHEQQYIAEILSCLDDKIDLLQRNNKTLEELAKTLFKNLLSKLQDREFATLGDYIKIQNGYAFKSNDFKDSGNNGVLKITNISFEHIDIQNTQFIDDKVIKGLSEKFLAKPKSFLIAMTGAEIGKIGIIGNTNKKLYINQRVGMLLDIEENSSLIGYLFLKSAEGQDHIITTCTGSAQENISSVGIESMIVPKITKEEVLDICKNINPLFKKIVYNLEQIQQLETIRDTLLPKLMSGKVRVEN